jgi:glycerate 2-kinase
MAFGTGKLLLDMFMAAVDAALPERCLPAHLPPRPSGRTIVIGAAGAMAKEIGDHWSGSLEGPVVTLESTVTARGSRRGGRNAEFLLALGVALDGRPGIYAQAGDVDGIDGTEDKALRATPPAWEYAPGIGPPTMTAMAFFAALDDLIMTGPARTNVNEFRAVLVAR